MTRWKQPAVGDRVTITIRATVASAFIDTEQRNVLELDYGAVAPLNLPGTLYVDVDARGVQDLVNLDQAPVSA
jgi:hypothetical protein